MKIRSLFLYFLIVSLISLTMDHRPQEIEYKDGVPGCLIRTVYIHLNAPDEIKWVWYPIDHLPKKKINLILDTKKKINDSANGSPTLKN